MVSLYFSINTAWLQLPSSQHGWKTQDYITQEHIRTSGLSKSVSLYKIWELNASTKNSNTYSAAAHRHEPPLLSTWPSVLFLVRFNNSDWIWASIGVTCSYSRWSHPFLCVLARYIAPTVYNMHTTRVSILRWCDGSESLLSSRVPNLQLHLLPIHINCPDLEINTNSCYVRPYEEVR